MTGWEYFLVVFVGLTVWRAILNRRVAKNLPKNPNGPADPPPWGE